MVILLTTISLRKRFHRSFIIPLLARHPANRFLGPWSELPVIWPNPEANACYTKFLSCISLLLMQLFSGIGFHDTTHG